MVYITGDIHGDVKYIREAIEQYSITGNDIIVILGDVGMNYYGKHQGLWKLFERCYHPHPISLKLR